jgi:Uma2 family endonuclease
MGDCYIRAMAGAAPLSTLATFAELAALGEDVRAEVIDGVVVERAAPRVEHADTQLGGGAFLRRRYGRGGGGRWPGGWWIVSEIDVEYTTHRICCHDLAGWRRDRHSERPSGRPLRARPDWVCEILSPGHEKRDLVDKFRILRDAGVPHYWILNAEEKVLIVYRLEPGGYLVALSAASGEMVRAEPFDDVDLPVAVLFGDADDED